MKHIILLVCALMIYGTTIQAQQKREPWKNSQLMASKTLADKILKHQAGNILILSIGPEAVIKGSVNMGSAQESENLAKLKDHLKSVPKNKEVVIYCGCCPFDKCPNIRPAFQVLTEMGFKNAKLLNLPKNIKVDWLDKDYPAND